MKIFRLPALTSAVVGFALALGSIHGAADDIDIYVAPNSSLPPEDRPKVMLSLDWRPNVINSPKCGSSACDFLVDEGYLESTEDVKFFDLLRAVLHRVFDNLSGVDIGLMMNHADENCHGPQTGNKKCTNGGYIVKGFTPIDTEAGKQAILDRLYAIPEGSGDGHSYQGAELFFEFFRYLTGQGIYNGHNGWNDFQWDSNLNSDEDHDGALSWDQTIESGSNYISPLVGTNGCGNALYTINFMFQVANQDGQSDNAITASREAGGMEGINLKQGAGQVGAFGRVIEYLNDVDIADGTWGSAADIPGNQNVTSYFVVDENSINNKTNGYAQAGGTGSAIALSDDPVELIKTIEDIFKQILSVSTTFVSGSLPIDVFNRVDLGDDVYVAIFRADAEAKPRWNGNLKKLKLVEDPPGNPVLWDARDDPAINPIDGRINSTALTFWTDPDHVPAPPEDETDWTEGSDGRATTQGGAGGDIPGFAPETNYHPGLTNPVGDATAAGPRLLFTEPDTFTQGSLNTFMALNADEATAATLLAADDELFKTVLPTLECTSSPCDSYGDLSDGGADQQLALDRMVELLAFARGLEDNNDDGDFDDEGDKRAWFMGDPLHSRPRPVNYGGPSADQQEIRILMTSNDGFVRMFDAETGMENWGFMPRDVMPVLKRLRDNNAGPDPIHPYTIDSTVSTLFVDGNRDNQITDVADDIAIAVVGMRRGGKHYYALDIKDPDDPKLLWRIGPDTPGFAQIGQTWSIPATVSLPLDLDGDPDTRDWGFIFAGGYNGDDDGDKIADTGETHLGKDERDATAYFADADDTEGNAIYIVEAATGTLLWKATGPGPDVATPTTGTVTTGTSNGETFYHYQHADMVDSIAADVSIGNIFSDLFDDRAYVGDTGGVIWRVDFLEGDFPEDDPRECTVGTDPRECWKVTRLFSSGRHFTADTLNDRRHHHAVDIALAQDTTGEYVAVVAATGNRAHPLSTETQDYLYMIKDRIAKSPSLPTDSSLDHDDLADLTDNCLQDETPCDTPDLSGGWKMGLVQCPAQFSGPDGTMCGEKGLSKPTTFLGTVRFTTYIPPDTSGLNLSCEPSEGTGTRYAIKLNDATAVFNYDASNDSADSITLDRFERLASGGIPSDIIRVGTTSDGQGIWMSPDHTFELDADLSYLRTYWYQEVIK